MKRNATAGSLPTQGRQPLGESPSPNGRLPIGNQNNQHCTNSLSADADATLRRRVAYLLNAYAHRTPLQG
ncbi:MAG: hypothetical protein LBU34_03065 [Planctomycetaceae bacterium]|nr:hypothetical protein [Planctomycetaceae bacterium]